MTRSSIPGMTWAVMTAGKVRLGKSSRQWSSRWPRRHCHAIRFLSLATTRYVGIFIWQGQLTDATAAVSDESPALPCCRA